MDELKPVQSASECGHPVTIGVLTAFLRSGRMLDQASSVLLLGVLLLLVLHPPSWPGIFLPGIAIVLAIAEKYHAWRVALDAELFAVLLKNPHEPNRFDAALAAFLACGKIAAGRTMYSRWQGARRLFCRQALCLGLQLLASLAALLA